MFKNFLLRNPDASPISSWAEWFDRAADHYQDLKMKMSYYTDAQTGQPVPDQVMQAIYQDIWQKLEAKKDHTLLDVGCGVGLFYKTCSHQVKGMVGTDISLAMIKEAFHLNPQGQFLICNSPPLPFQSSQFDRLVCYSVFQYFENFEQAAKILDDFVRLIKNNGIIFVGDIVDPATDSMPQPQDPKNKTGRWWPAALNHNLKKLRYPPEFFIDYCRQRNLTCEILEQNISGRYLPDKRYDVRIRVKK